MRYRGAAADDDEKGDEDDKEDIISLLIKKIDKKKSSYYRTDTRLDNTAKTVSSTLFTCEFVSYSKNTTTTHQMMKFRVLQSSSYNCLQVNKLHVLIQRHTLFWHVAVHSRVICHIFPRLPLFLIIILLYEYDGCCQRAFGVGDETILCPYSMYCLRQKQRRQHYP